MSQIPDREAERRLRLIEAVVGENKIGVDDALKIISTIVCGGSALRLLPRRLDRRASSRAGRSA